MGLIWSAGLMVSKAMKQSTGTLVPHKLRDSSFLHLLTRTRRPLSVTWRQHHMLIVCIKEPVLWLQTKPKRLDYGYLEMMAAFCNGEKGLVGDECSSNVQMLQGRSFWYLSNQEIKDSFFFKMIKKWIFKIPILRHY